MQNIKQNINQMQMIRQYFVISVSVGHSPTLIFKQKKKKKFAGFAWSCISIKYLETTELLYIERGSTKTQLSTERDTQCHGPRFTNQVQITFCFQIVPENHKVSFLSAEFHHTNTFSALVIFLYDLFII